MHIDDAQTDTHVDDEDLTTADRGDDLRDDSATDDDESAPGKEPGRDEKGRFTKKNGGDEEAESDAATDEDEDGEAADDETDDEGDGASAAKKDPKNFAIRFNKAKQQRDAAIERARELENELAKLRGGKSEADAASPTDKLNSELDALYEKVEDARADGDTKAAAALQRQIDGKNREIARIEAAELAAKTTQASTVSARFDALLDVAETLVPELSVGADTYDEEAVREIQFQVEAYSRMGMPADKALVKAVKVLHGVDLGAKRASKTEYAVETTKAPKKKVDVAKALDTQRRQPPDASARGVNRDSSRIRYSELSEEDFDKLPESVKSRERGDTIA